MANDRRRLGQIKRLALGQTLDDVDQHHVGQGAFRKLSPEAYNALWKKNQAYFEKKFGVAWTKRTPREGVAAVESKVGA